MMNYIDTLSQQLITLIIPLVGIRLLLDYMRMLLFNKE